MLLIVTPQTNNIFDCIVLSGGGAKGSYGAGVASALFAFYDLKRIKKGICYLGTSAGALNAGVLASYGPEKLKELWLSSANNRTVLGVRRLRLKARFFRRLLKWVSPYSIFDNDKLRQLIEANVDFNRLDGKHLIVLTTNYNTGTLKAFYSSYLIDDFVNYDRGLKHIKQRLSHFERINNQEELVLALLASSSIPVFFPPVRIKNDWYVDGGVGNNTPTREAAYFLRFLNTLGKGDIGEVFCIKQDPPEIIESQPSFGLLDIVKRTTEISQYIHIQPIIEGFSRINYETQQYKARLDGLIEWINSKSYDAIVADEITKEVKDRMGTLGGATARINVPFTIIDPSTFLGDTLDFSPTSMRENIKHGFHDMLKALGNRIDDAEHKILLSRLKM
ncbi:MAG: patatin-like phospholipase family protein [Acidobacteriota bacterium]|nr:patatin-like phospholipase family protein [Acidobacteriota bacterium]